MFYSLFIAPFVEFDFMRRALVGMFALSVAGSPIGVFLMLRRMSLTGDAMAHAVLPGAAIGYLVAGFSLPAMTLGGLATGLTVVLAAGAVARATVMKEDAALAVFYLISLALGVTIVSMRGSAVDLFHVLFGNVLALDDAVLVLLACVSTLTLGYLALLYRPLVMECVDPGFLRSVGGRGGFVHLTFLALVLINLVAGFHALGTLLAVGLMILPAAAARFWTADLTRLILLASAFGMVSGYVGLVASSSLGGGNLPAGPVVILAAGTLYVGSLVIGSHGGLARRLLPRTRLQH